MMENTNSYHLNSQRAYESDIFNTKGLNNDVELFAHKRKFENNNKESYDFYATEVPKQQPLTDRNKIIKSNNLKSTIFNNDPIEIKKPRKEYAAGQTHIKFEQSDNSDYKIKRPEYKSDYNPDKYLKTESNFERKFKNLYVGENETIDPKFITKNQKSIKGTIDKELSKNENEYNPNLTAHERLYNNLYNSSLKTEPNLPPPKTIKVKRKTDEKDNKILLNYQSNIFNIEEKEKENNNNLNEDKNTNKFKNKKLISQPKINDENLQKVTEGKHKYNNSTIPTKLDWRVGNSNLYTKVTKDDDVDKNSAHQRKLNELFGGEGNKNLPNKNINNEKLKRKELENELKSFEPNESDAAIRKKMEQYGTYQNLDINAKKYEKEPKNKTFELKNFDFDKFDVEELKNVFSNNGIHLFDLKEDNQYSNGKTKGKITFSVRENNTDDKFFNKLKKIKKEIKNKQGAEIREIDNNPYNKAQKHLTSQIPTNINWNHHQMEDLIKKRNMDKNIHPKTHRYTKSNIDDQRITAIYINHKYKNK